MDTTFFIGLQWQPPTANVPQMLLTQEEAYRFLGVSRKTFFRLKARKALPEPIRLIGRQYWRKEDLERWALEQ